MSLILDALNKSERERPVEHTVPGVQTQHDASSAVGRPWWHYGAGLILFSLAAIALFSLLTTGTSETPTPAELAIGEQPAAVVAVQSPSPVSAPGKSEDVTAVGIASQTADSAEGPVDAGPAPDIAALYSTVPDKTVLDKTASDNTVPAPAVAAAELPQPEAGSADSPDGLDVEAIARAARLELDAPAYEVSSIPLVTELDQRTRDEIPTIYFSAHAWSRAATDSVVTLNGKSRQEGDSVAPGVTLVEILENSIVLDFRGTSFRLRSLNSWVNL